MFVATAPRGRSAAADAASARVGALRAAEARNSPRQFGTVRFIRRDRLTSCMASFEEAEKRILDKMICMRC
ncbi:MAG: hypothetical protein RI568_10575, partial [Natronomonas sp.]|nr:hypothetical protein [Natronomonas sp.]